MDFLPVGSHEGAQIRATASFSHACVNCNIAEALLPRLTPVANGGFFLKMFPSVAFYGTGR